MNAKAILAQKEEYLTAEEFALLVGYHLKSIYRLIERHQLPGVIRIGRSILIDRTIALQTIPVTSSTVNSSPQPSAPVNTSTTPSAPAPLTTT